MKKFERVNITIDAETRKMAKVLAKKTKLSLSAFLRTLIIDCYETQKEGK